MIPRTFTTLIAATIGFSLTIAPVAASPAEPVAIEVLSNRADLISGGDALVRVNLPEGADAGDVRVTVDDHDVTGSFAVRPNGEYQGLVTGLADGDNTLTAELPGSRGARLVITNHPIGGPVFAGPQVQPWICTTEDAGLGAPQDEQCNAPAVITYQYKSSVTHQFAAYDPDNPPGDVAETTTDQGRTVPYIVQVETGTMDRGIYRIGVLAEPDEQGRPWAPPSAWNGKVVWPFGGGTAPDHRQGPPLSVLDDSALSRGFLIANSSLTVHGQNANDTVSAEAVMMLKEHIAETYGPIRYTIGEGCSGGGLQQHIIAATYPGLLDGLIPMCSYPDIWSTAMEVGDCVLLDRYFNETSPHLWLAAQQRAFVAGHQDPASCPAWVNTFGPVLDPTVASNCALPEDEVYDPDDNPEGVRCTIQDYQVAIWGKRPASVWDEVEQRIGSGFAQRPYDNVGVQYGLDALNSGEITPEQFADLNSKIGGGDIDGDPQPGRVAADPGSLATAYRAGQVTDAQQLATVPIIDLRGQSNSEIHSSFNSYTLRARLTEANDTYANQAIWTGAITLVGDTTFLNCGSGTTNGVINSPSECPANSALRVMDDWLAKIEADTSGTPLADKVIRSRPAAAADSCWLAGRQVTDTNACRAAFPYFANPRMTAGGPLANDILKCRLKPLDRADYPVEFSDEQWAALQEAFPAGVCDWRKPGVDQQPSQPWLTFADGPGGRPLGDPPVSTPLRPGGKNRP